MGLGKIDVTTSVVPAGGSPERLHFRMEQLIENRPGFLLPEHYYDLLTVHRALSHPSMRTLVVRMN
jgi:hypothetical protein